MKAWFNNAVNRGHRCLRFGKQRSLAAARIPLAVDGNCNLHEGERNLLNDVRRVSLGVVWRSLWGNMLVGTNL
jgi:hypothetical protein